MRSFAELGESGCEVERSEAGGSRAGLGGREGAARREWVELLAREKEPRGIIALL